MIILQEKSAHFRSNKALRNINFTKKLKRFSNCSQKLLLFKDMILQ